MVEGIKGLQDQISAHEEALDQLHGCVQRTRAMRLLLTAGMAAQAAQQTVTKPPFPYPTTVSGSATTDHSSAADADSEAASPDWSAAPTAASLLAFIEAEHYDQVPKDTPSSSLQRPDDTAEVVDDPDAQLWSDHVTSLLKLLGVDQERMLGWK